MKIGRKIELLAPAKNSECGIEAINHGADAVYIGASRLGARAAAGNSVDDIHTLTRFAHQYFAKVYVTLNTIVLEDELSMAEKLAWELYEAGADALIIQDMGLLRLNLPPIALHASTQADNRTVEKLQFLQNSGFSQVVLARELSINDIKAISRHTDVALEVFVHGALCVSYSGQCYLSHALSGRSANRGECAQYCRLPYTLQDAAGNNLMVNKHLLSLKDLNHAENLENLLDAGVSSLKIEGRLKDLSYVKNITAYYRQKLDEIMKRRPEFIKASSGDCRFYFTPDPEKSFNRGFTDYFLKKRNKNITSFDTPKSFGEVIGTVKDLSKNYFTVSGKKPVHNGDGLCFLNERKELEGFRVNRSENGKIFPLEMPRLHPGITLYRNYDHEFERLLLKKSVDRKIKLEFTLEETENGFKLSVLDEDGLSAEIYTDFAKEISQKNQKENIYAQISKLGHTIFEMGELLVLFTKDWFIPSSILSYMKKQVIEALLAEREKKRPVEKRKPESVHYPFPHDRLTYLGNVANSKARQFYRDHGVSSINDAFELSPQNGALLMFTKHCIRYALGHCPHSGNSGNGLKEPLFLKSNQFRLQLKFDCNSCEMKVYKTT